MPTIDQVNKRIEELERTIGSVVPIIATTGSIIRLVGGLVKGKMSPVERKTFDDAVAGLDAQNASLQSAIDGLRKASVALDGTASGTLDGMTAPVGSKAVSGPEGHSGG